LASFPRPHRYFLLHRHRRKYCGTDSYAYVTVKFALGHILNICSKCFRTKSKKNNNKIILNKTFGQYCKCPPPTNFQIST
jgi:hypothetical protein